MTQKIVPFTSVSLDNPQTEFLSNMSLIIQKATAEDAGMRYQTIQELRFDIEKALEQNDLKTPNVDSTSPPMINKLLVAGCLVAACVIATMSILYFMRNREILPDTFESSYSNHHVSLPSQDAVSIQKTTLPAKTIRGKDGSLMVLAGDPADSSDDTLLYIDREKISNFLFVEFLNNFKKHLSVKNGIIRYGETIVMYIGDGTSEEDRIIYQHDKFHLKNQADGDKPVLRVSFHGAHMYAAYYQKELLSAGQWLFAYQYFSKHPLPKNGSSRQDKTKIPAVSGMMESHMGISSEAETRGNEVLDKMGKNVREWVSIPQAQGNDPTPSKTNRSPEPGIISAEEATNGKQPLKRLPWEAFDDVGFRTMIPVVKAQ